MTDSSLSCARDLLAFIDASPTPYHAVAEARRRLLARGYRELDEREEWAIEPGGRYFVVRAGGTLVAFDAGTAPPAEAGFVLIGAHTDSPNLRLKPSAEQTTAGHRQLGVEVYGGVLLSTWMDRDLSLAGRVTLRGSRAVLVRFDRVLCRIPMLAIHLDREVNVRGLVLNPQTHLVPTWGLEAEDAQTLAAALVEEIAKDGPAAKPEEILGFDLCLYDTTPSAIGGARGELVLAPRLDNLASCHAALEALAAAGEAGRSTRLVALYDHEEVGSQSAAGARSRFLRSVLDRIARSYPGATAQATSRALARSLLVSADMAHAVHPNYADRHDKLHAPRLGKGPAIKVNANQSYATDAPSAARFLEACREAGFAPQHFVTRTDLPCGSTIGPISAAALGVRTIDVGNPMLSMHSCRELAGSADVEPMIRAMAGLLAHPDPPHPAD
jgi:aspartyl aminopeptidase